MGRRLPWRQNRQDIPAPLGPPSFNSNPPTAFYTTIALHLAWQANKTVTLQLPQTRGIRIEVH